MSDSRFVVREGHIHIADPDSFVMTGWFRGKPAASETFEVFLDRKKLKTQVLMFSDDSVRQKYAKHDIKITEEYVIIAKLPEQLQHYRWLYLYENGSRVYEHRVSKLQNMRRQLDCRITDIQITGASCVINGWAASEKPVKIHVYDRSKKRVQCEVSHFPKPDVALEHREAEHLSDCGFSVTVPMQGRKQMLLQITNGEVSVVRRFSAVDKNRVMLYAKKAHYYMKRNGLKKACKRAVNEAYELIGDTGNYMKWRKKNMPSARELAEQQRNPAASGPLIYVITPYEDSPCFSDTVLSMKNQTYGNWKWILACTAEEKETAARQLRGRIQRGRVSAVTVEVKVEVKAEAETGADAQQKTAAAVEKVKKLLINQKNTWMTLLGPQDTLEPNALYDCVKVIDGSPDARMCYTDEDMLSQDGNTYKNPVFKSDFNIDMLRAMNYLGHMVLLRGDLVQQLEAWNPAYGADAPYDYYLRAAESSTVNGLSNGLSIIHLQKAVYHVRETIGQHTVTDTKSATAVLNAHYKRLGIPAEAQASDTPGIYHTVYHWKETPMVSVNIPNKDHIDDLDTCVQSVLKKCSYPNYEIVIIENNSTEERTFAYYEKIQKQDARVRVIYWKDVFNFSKITNFGASHSRGEYLLLLNNDTEVITPDFMEEMLGYCMREDVGICGARLFYFDDTIQHAGVIVGLGGICGEGFQGFPKENGGYQNRIFCPQDYSAVTAACMMTKKSVFEEAGGMDGELQIAYNDIDYCLKVRNTGRLVVYNPFAMMHHYEYKSRGTENTAAKLARYNREVDLFTARWAELISAGDPYYNPNLTRRYQDFSLRRIELL